MRKPFLIIIWSIAAVCAVVGIIIHVFPGAGISSGGGRSIDTGSFNSGGQYETTDAFSTLDIDCATAVITVEQGEEYAVEITAKNPSKAKRMPVWELKNDTLTVYQESKNFISLGPLNDTTYYVNVTVPDTDVELKKINIDSGTGTVSLSGISTDQLKIDTGTGTVNVSDCKVNDLEIDSGTGSTTAELISAAERIDIDNGTGSISVTLPGTENDYDLDIDNGVGSVTVDGEKRRGEYTSSGSGGGTIRIDNGTGSINISFTGDIIS